MKTKVLIFLAGWVITATLAVAMFGCASLKREFSSPEGTTNAPPLVEHIQAYAVPPAAALPTPWNTIALAFLGTITTVAGAYATHRARQAIKEAPAAWETTPPTPEK